MDIHTLVAAHFGPDPHPAPMDAKAEDRYYAEQFEMPELRPRLWGPIVLAACAMLFLVGLVPG